MSNTCKVYAVDCQSWHKVRNWKQEYNIVISHDVNSRLLPLKQQLSVLPFCLLLAMPVIANINTGRLSDVSAQFAYKFFLHFSRDSIAGRTARCYCKLHHILLGQCPPYLADLVTFSADDTHRRRLRSSTNRAAVIQRTKTQFGTRAFSVSGTVLLYGTRCH